MSDLIKELNDLQKQKEIFEKNVKENGENLFKKLFEDIQSQFPKIEKIYWNQYTPYWNDGDICTFGIGCIFINEFERVPLDCIYENNEIYPEISEILPSPEKNGPMIADMILKLERIAEIAFGDGVRVVLEKDKITITECEDHD